jgi:outer membrane protein TolC
MKRRILLPVLLAAALAGCRSFDTGQARAEQTEAFRHRLAEKTERWLARPLGLHDCLRIAVTNNYQARQADLQRTLAKLGKDIAFAEFLPQVTASARATRNRFPTAYGGMVFERRSHSSAGLDVDLPILTPSAWFLYAARRQNVRVAEIAAHHVRQTICLEVTRAYYACLVQEELIRALRTQRDAAQETYDRVEGLAAEGLSAAWEREQALAQLGERASELAQAERALATATGDLLVLMGLPPDAPATLSGEAEAPAPTDETAEALVLRALASHPELAMADREVVIRDHQVRQAFCEFLPRLSGFWSGSYLDNAMYDRLSNWSAGLAGTWNVFDGLANVADYRASKVNRTSSSLNREYLFLTVMLEVIRAEAGIRDAADAFRTAEQNHRARALKSANYRAKMREGLIPVKDSLEAEAERDAAQVAVVRNRHQEAIARATLELAMGVTALPEGGVE